MTVETTSVFAGPYTTDGVATAFPFSFKAMSADEVRVEIGGAIVPSGLYTVQIAAQSGSVTFVTPPAAGGELYVISDPDFRQGISFSNQSAFLPTSHNEANDRAAVRDQVLRDGIERSFQVPIAGGVDGMFPVVLPGNGIGFASGTGNDPALRTDIAKPAGGGLMGYSSTAASSRGTVADRLKRFVVATDAPWNAKGDGTTDDYAAIQAALDYVEAQGGGDVALPMALGQRYRITQGVKIGSYCGLVGAAAARYPFNSGNANNSGLIADFTNANQAVIEPKTTKGAGGAYAYNEQVTGSSSPNFTYNCSVRNLTISSVGVMPYVGIRMHGCPGSTVDNVAINNVGCGLLVNYCFGGSYSVHCLTPYYGVVAWDDVNGNNFEVYAAQSAPFVTAVPAGYLLPFFNAMNGALVPTHKLSTNEHYNRPKGFALGSSGSTSNANVADVVVERFTDGVFLFYAYSTDLRKLYLEGDTGQMKHGIAAAQSTFSTQAQHTYLSGTGNAFDFGVGVGADLRLNGSLFALFGSVASDTTTSVMIRGVTINQFGPSVPQFNIRYEMAGPFANLTLLNSWGNAGQYIPPAYRREGARIVFQGAVNGGANGSVIASLPAGSRPYLLTPFKDFDVDPNGNILAKTGAAIALTGLSFEVIQ